MKPVAYEGKEPYLFVSYAHKDSDRVFLVINELAARGCRIWYDDGIAPGSEWPEDIARHLYAAQMVIAFITPASMASENCRREINFALSKKKPFLSIVLEETKIPLGMEMQLAARQSIPRYNFSTLESFIERVLKCPDITPCIGEGAAASPQPETAPAAAPKETAAPKAADPEREAKLVAVFNEAAAYAAKEEYQKELEVLAGALSYAPDDCSLLVKLGRVYRRLGYSKKALEYYEKAKAADPGDPTIYANIGAVYLTAGEYETARPYYEQALALMEKDPLCATKGDKATTYGNYGLCLGELGDLNGAKKNLIVARKIGYGADMIRNICQRIHIRPNSVLKDSFWR